MEKYKSVLEYVPEWVAEHEQYEPDFGGARCKFLMEQKEMEQNEIKDKLTSDDAEQSSSL